MSLTTITYSLRSSLPPDAARDRVAALLTAERVRYTQTPDGLQSTRTPYGLNVQRVWYTRRNWVGLNPFAHVSGVQITFAPADVTVHVNRTRALYLAAPYMAGCLLTPFLPWPGVVALLAGCTGLTWFVASYVAGHLLKAEIERELNPRAA